MYGCANPSFGMAPNLRKKYTVKGLHLQVNAAIAVLTCATFCYKTGSYSSREKNQY